MGLETVSRAPEFRLPEADGKDHALPDYSDMRKGTKYGSRGISTPYLPRYAN